MSSLFPYFVSRVAGLPTRCIEELRSEVLPQLCMSIRQQEENLSLVANKLEVAVFCVISHTEKRNQRGTLLRLKRDIHNLRPICGDLDIAVGPLLPADLLSEIIAFFDSAQAYSTSLIEFDEEYSKEVGKLRQTFRNLAQDSDFQKGLLLSSQSLFSLSSEYLCGTGSLQSGKDRQIERGLLRYFTRMVMKTSPFGTFCTLNPGEIQACSLATEHKHSGSIFEGSLQEKRSFIRINKSLYGILLEHLKSRPTIRDYLCVELNPTVRRIELSFRFLSLVNGREIFQRLETNEALEIINAALAETPNTVLRQLVDVLCRDPRLTSSRKETSDYVVRLLEIGFLRFRVGIKEQEVDWDLPLAALLDTIDDEHAREIALLLHRLRNICEEFPTAGVSNRAILLASTRSLLESSFKFLNISGKLRMNLPFYEDATSSACMSLPSNVIEAIRQKLSAWCDLTYRIASPRSQRATMRHFFDTFYANRLSCVSLLEFYEDYFREHFKSHLEKEQRRQAGKLDEDLKEYDLGNPFKLEFVQQITAAHSRITELIRNRWLEDPKAEEIRIDLKEIESIVERVEEPRDVGYSVSLFAQLILDHTDQLKPALFVNNGSYVIGYGKYFSRFLYMLPERIRDAVFAHNGSMSDDVLAEICGDGYFNANLHPPLLRWEISYPTGESGNAEDQVSTTDITVEADPEDTHSLILRSRKTGKRIIPVDLGFQNPRLRPPLFQLLSWFTPASFFLLRIPDVPNPVVSQAPAEYIEKSTHMTSGVRPEQKEYQIQYRPRIVLDGDIVLARRRWQMPSTGFLKMSPEKPDSLHFLELQHWRREHGIPNQVFMRIQAIPPAQKQTAPGTQQNIKEGNDPTQQKTNSEDARTQKRVNARVSSDLYKPQFIDFDNPLLAGLFVHILSGLDRFVATFEERLPSERQLCSTDGDRYVTEFILQISQSNSEELDGKARRTI